MKNPNKRKGNNDFVISEVVSKAKEDTILYYTENRDFSQYIQPKMNQKQHRQDLSSVKILKQRSQFQVLNKLNYLVNDNSAILPTKSSTNLESKCCKLLEDKSLESFDLNRMALKLKQSRRIQNEKSDETVNLNQNNALFKDTYIENVKMKEKCQTQSEDSLVLNAKCKIIVKNNKYSFQNDKLKNQDETASLKQLQNAQIKKNIQGLPQLNLELNQPIQGFNQPIINRGIKTKSKSRVSICYSKQVNISLVNMEYFKLNPSPEQRVHIHFQSQQELNTRDQNSLSIPKTDRQQLSKRLSLIIPPLTERCTQKKHSIKQKTIEEIDEDRYILERSYSEFHKKNFNSMQKYNTSGSSSIQVVQKLAPLKIHPSLIVQIGGSQVIDLVIQIFKNMNEQQQDHHLFDYSLFRRLFLISFDRDSTEKEIIFTLIRKHFKEIKLGQIQLCNFITLMKQSFESLQTLSQTLKDQCILKLEQSFKFIVPSQIIKFQNQCGGWNNKQREILQIYMQFIIKIFLIFYKQKGNVTLLEEAGGEEAVIEIVIRTKEYILKSDEIMQHVLEGKGIKCDEQMTKNVSDFLKLLLIDPTIYQAKRMCEEVQSYDFSYLDFFRLKFILEKQLKLMKWTEVTIRMFFSRLEQFRFFILRPPSFFLRVLKTQSILIEIQEELFMRLKCTKFIYQHYFNNRIKLETLSLICQELVPFLINVNPNKDFFFSILKPFKAHKLLLSPEFFELFALNLTEVLKLFEFESLFIFDVQRKIQLLIQAENIIEPFLNQFPPTAFEDISSLIIQGCLEQIEISLIIDTPTIQQVVLGQYNLNRISSPMLLSDCFDRLVNDLMPAYYPIWDLKAIKIWYPLDKILIEQFKIGIAKYLDINSTTIHISVQKFLTQKSINYFNLLEFFQ